jgi:putative transposase
LSSRATARREFHPPHIREQNACYFITASTVDHAPWFDTDAKRLMVRDTLKEAVTVCEIRLYAWVILSDHYHLLLRTGDIAPINHLIKRLHGRSAILLNKLDNAPGRHIWYQYWDRCPRNEDEFWRYFNYIHVNPAKHGYVRLVCDGLEKERDLIRNRPEEPLGVHECLQSYPHSSYHYYLRTYGVEFLTDILSRYPISDYAQGDKDMASPTI